MIYTARYANRTLLDPRYVIVRISRGTPHWMPPEVIWSAIPSLAPEWRLHGLPVGKFEVAYREQMDAVGAPAIVRALELLTDFAGNHDVALCCFEDIRKPGQFCHRRMFADWFAEQTGAVIAELHEEPPKQASLL